jgi:hypothetical protein
MKVLMQALLLLSCLSAESASADESLVAHWQLDPVFKLEMKMP